MWQKSLPDFGSAEPLSTSFSSLVIGAGPAGLAVTSTLLDRGSDPVLWVDPEFSAGRLRKYLEVPSNTKTKLFAQYAKTPSHTAGAASWALQGLQVSTFQYSTNPACAASYQTQLCFSDCLLFVLSFWQRTLKHQMLIYAKTRTFRCSGQLALAIQRPFCLPHCEFIPKWTLPVTTNAKDFDLQIFSPQSVDY